MCAHESRDKARPCGEPLPLMSQDQQIKTLASVGVIAMG